MTPAAHARDAPEDATDLTARVHRGKALGWTVLALLYTVGPLWIVNVLPARSSADNPIGFAALLLVCVFSGAAAARGLLILVSRGPRLVVNRTGIVLHSMVLGTSVLPWSEIEALIVFKTLFRQHIMKIVLSDARPLLARHTAVQSLGLLLLQSRLSRSATLLVGDSMLDTPLPHVLARMQERFAHELKEYRILVVRPKR